VSRLSDALWDDSGVNMDRSGVKPVAHAVPTRWMRVARGVVGAAFATFTAAFSHVAAGGALPSPAALALTLALSTLLCIALAGRAHSLWRTAAAVGLSQFLFHGIFSRVVATGTVVLSPHAGHDGVVSPVAAAATTSATHGAHPSWMWLAHGAAAVLTVVALRYSERALRSVAEATSLFLAPLIEAGHFQPVPSVRRSPRVGCARTVVPIDRTVLFSVLRHRGPPLAHTA
jgi:hypothetical protein